MTWIHHTRVNRDDWPSIYFSPAEVACKGTGMVLLTDASRAALRRLDDLRRAMGHPLILNSGHRTPEHNKAVGGAKNSYHMRGMAFDVRMDNTDPHEFEEQAVEAGFNGIGIYARSGFIHIDARPVEKHWRGVQQGREFPVRTTTRFAPEVRPKPVTDAAREVTPVLGVGVAIEAAIEQAEPVLRDLAPNLPERLAGYAIAAAGILAVALILLRVVRHARAKRAEGDAE
jgi:zinc D-Ala-D-Ala carboxypeptidase